MMQRRRSTLLDMGHVLLEAADATLSYLKSGTISVLVTSAVALVLFELLGAVIVVTVQWATSGAVSMPDALQLELSIVTPISCGLVTLLSIVNLLRLVGGACLRAAHTAVASARLHGVSNAAYDADVWPLPISASPYYVVPTPLAPSLPTQPLARPFMPYRRTHPNYYPQPWSDGMPLTYQWGGAPQVYGREAPTYLPPVGAIPYVSPQPVPSVPYGYAYGSLYPVAAQTHAA